MSCINASHDELTKMFNDGTTEVDKVVTEKLADVLGKYGFRGTLKVTVEVAVQSDHVGLDEARSWSATTSFHR